MKYCKDCKHYQHAKKIKRVSNTYSAWGGFKTDMIDDVVEVMQCLKNPEIDLVSGQPQYRFATVERTIINERNHCGKEGKWFEPITEDADLDDLSTIPFGR